MVTITEPYWKHLRQVITSPQFHWFFLKARLQQNFLTASPYRCFIALIFSLTVIGGVVMTNSCITFVVAWIFPLTILYQCSALLQISSEHCWGSDCSTESKSHGRFCGEAPPFNGSRKDWLMFTFRMIFYHLLVRVAVLCDPEICVHDHHHLYPKADKDWPNAIYSRQQQVESDTNYQDIWGLENAIDHVFKHLAQSPPLTDDMISTMLEKK